MNNELKNMLSEFDGTDLYHFVESWKHSFTYRKGDTLYTIQGDIYRDEFMPTLDEKRMSYFKDKSMGDNWVIETKINTVVE